MAEGNRALDTVSENIRILDRRAEMTEKQSDICVEQLCRLVKDENDDIYSVWENFCERAGKADVAHKAALCRHICESPRYSAALIDMLAYGDAEDVSAAASRRIAYVRNKRNDKIFLDFSDRIKGARAHYATSFSDACEAVFNGTCEYCILPVENGRDGKLYSFYSMMDRYELKIVQIIREDSEDGSESIIFALVGKTLSLPIKGGRGQMFELSVIHESADFVADVIAAVNSFGGRLKDVGTQPVQYDEPRRKFYFTVDLNGASAMPLALYMTLEYAGYAPMGFYTV